MRLYYSKVCCSSGYYKEQLNTSLTNCSPGLCNLLLSFIILGFPTADDDGGGVLVGREGGAGEGVIVRRDDDAFENLSSSSR